MEGHGEDVTRSVQDQLDAGNLQGAIEAASAGVKSDPTDISKRTTLFELLCFSGDLDRAEKHLEAIGQFESDRALAVLGYKQMVRAERRRREVFAGKARPRFLGDASSVLTDQLELISALEGGEPGLAARVARIDTARPKLGGKFNGERITDVRDSDDRMLAVCEAILDGQYTWIGWDQMRALEAEEPVRLRDLCWFPVLFRFADGEAKDGFLPGLYVNSYGASDDGIRLGRRTDWDDRNGVACGLGRRVFFVGPEEERDVLGLRNLELQAEGGGAA